MSFRLTFQSELEVVAIVFVVTCHYLKLTHNPEYM